MDIEKLLRSEFNILYCDVRNTSAEHHGHTGYSENSHFSIVLVSQDFEGLSKVARHRRVFKVVEKYFTSGLHALSMSLLTPSEYKDV